MSHRFPLPKIIPNQLLVGGCHLLSILTGHTPQRIIDRHRRDNRQWLSGSSGAASVRSAIAADGSASALIEGQDELAALYFGTHRRSNLAYSGCGIIAVCNAFAFRAPDLNASSDVSLRSPESYATISSLPDLIAAFECRGSVLHGGFGISPYAIYRFLRRYIPDAGLTYTSDPAKINAFGRSYRCFVTTIYNHAEDITKGLHTVCITTAGTQFIAHNIYRRSHGRWIAGAPQPTLADAVYGITPHARPIVVIGLR